MYISAGLVLILLMLMALVSKRRGWSVFNISRTAFVFTIGLGLCLVSLINTNHDKTDYFLTTPWPLPTIMLCFLAVLIITHLPHPPRISFKRAPYHDVELGTVPAERTDEEASQINQTTKVDQIAQVYQVHQVSQNEDLGYHSGYHHEMAQPPQRGIDTFAHLPGHYDVGRKDDYTTKKLNRGTTLRRGLTSIQRVAKSIQIEAGGYDPIAEGELFFRGGNSSTVRPNNLYSV